jgi:hypothetical protein
MKRLEKRAAITTTADVTAGVGLAATHTQHIGRHVTKIQHNKFPVNICSSSFLMIMVLQQFHCTSSFKNDQHNAWNVAREADADFVGY